MKRKTMETKKEKKVSKVFAFFGNCILILAQNIKSADRGFYGWLIKR